MRHLVKTGDFNHKTVALYIIQEWFCTYFFSYDMFLVRSYGNSKGFWKAYHFNEVHCSNPSLDAWFKSIFVRRHWMVIACSTTSCSEGCGETATTSLWLAFMEITSLFIRRSSRSHCLTLLNACLSAFLFFSRDCLYQVSHKKLRDATILDVSCLGLV